MVKNCCVEKGPLLVFCFSLLMNIGPDQQQHPAVGELAGEGYVAVAVADVYIYINFYG